VSALPPQPRTLRDWCAGSPPPAERAILADLAWADRPPGRRRLLFYALLGARLAAEIATRAGVGIAPSASAAALIDVGIPLCEFFPDAAPATASDRDASAWLCRAWEMHDVAAAIAGREDPAAAGDRGAAGAVAFAVHLCDWRRCRRSAVELPAGLGALIGLDADAAVAVIASLDDHAEAARAALAGGWRAEAGPGSVRE